MAQANSTTKRIVLDPITRIEGHLRIETELNEEGVVTNAWSTGSLFRGIEIILKGRNPEDAWLFTQRVCGVCTYVHGAASVRSVEDAVGIAVPEKARIIRNLLMGAQFLHDHLIHFYHLHALDWVDLESALTANPAETSVLANSFSSSAAAIDYAAVKSRLQTFVASGKLGPFASGYWGHDAYGLTPEENLLFVAHYFEALRQQAVTARMHAIFGGKNPHVQSLRVGGVTCEEDINADRIKEFRSLLEDTKTFIDDFYIPGVRLFADRYPGWSTLGGNDHFLVFGEFQEKDGALLFPPGAIFDWSNGVEDLDTSQIFEHATHSWYEGTEAVHPAEGETIPSYTGLNTSDRYSWLKAPRYKGLPMEVGPLARILVAYLKGQKDVTAAVDDFLDRTGLELESLNSTLGRTAARALETQLIAGAMLRWVDDLMSALGDEEGAYAPSNIPMSAQGMGLNEAPRGALGHWINIENAKIANYQMVVPSTWNFGPRCAEDIPGPVESALVNTPVADAEKPLEILRTVHSFDPCIACAVHVLDRKTAKKYQVKVM